jgi:hypothetical protein
MKYGADRMIIDFYDKENIEKISLVIGGHGDIFIAYKGRNLEVSESEIFHLLKIILKENSL